MANEICTVTVIPQRIVIAMVNLDTGERTEFSPAIDDVVCTGKLPRVHRGNMITWGFRGPKDASELVFCSIEWNYDTRRFESDAAEKKLRENGCNF